MWYHALKIVLCRNLKWDFHFILSKPSNSCETCLALVNIAWVPHYCTVKEEACRFCSSIFSGDG